MATKLGVTTIHQLQLLPEVQRVPALCRRHENQWFDRRGARIRPRELADAMIRLRQRGAGLIVIGIRDGMIEGTGADDRAHNG